jgi:hypothetical protein
MSMVSISRVKTRDAIGLALSQLRVQKLKSAFTLLGGDDRA